MKGERSRRPPSGRFVLRIDPKLHAFLRAAARDEGRSLNDYCARRLAMPQALGSASDALWAAVDRALHLFGDGLVAVAAFGSWARGELADGSDLDLLIVLESRLPLSRALYRRWDDSPILWGGRVLEPHLVHLPDRQETVAGIWGEVALDGVVLLDRALRLSTRLVRIRRDLAAGRIVRRVVHGHPYWVRSEVA